MEESKWEASRRQGRKKTIVFLLFFIVIAAFATILFLNNRDLIGPFGSGGGVQTNDAAAQIEPEQTGGAAVIPQTAELSTMPSVSPSPVSIDSQPVPVQPSPSAPQNTAAPSSSSGDTPELKKQAAPDLPKLFSIELPPFPCRLESRKDVVIYLSLELFFSDNEKRAEIFFRRDDIKVMVLRTVRDKELTEMKKKELEPQLLHGINLLFDHAGITAVKIRNIHVEKAVEE